MAITYGFFNSLNSDRVYNADQMSEYFKGIVSDGVYESVGNALQVQAGSGMNVNIQTGRALIDCKWLDNDAVATIAISTAHPTLDRYTAVVVRLDRTNRLMSLTTIDGTPSSNPSKPNPTRTAQITDLVLAYVKVKKGVTQITSSAITDMRGSSYCSWVTGVIKQVDTSTLFTQYAAAYAENLAEMETWEAAQMAQYIAWFETLTSDLRINTHLERKSADKTVTSTGNYITIPSEAQYESGDILDVYINGIFLSPSKYAIESSGGSYMIATEDAIEAGNVINFSCIKSVIGNTAPTIGISEMRFNELINSVSTIEEGEE